MKEKTLPDPLFLWPDESVPKRKYRSKLERVIPDESPITLITGVNYPALIPFPAKGVKKPSPAVIVCPGGAYDVLALDYEGLEIAEYLSKRGISAFVLKYRVPKQREAALCDATRAVRYLRYYADKFGIRKTPWASWVFRPEVIFPPSRPEASGRSFTSPQMRSTGKASESTTLASSTRLTSN